MHAARPTGDASHDNLRQRYETNELRRQTTLIYVGNGVAASFLLTFGILAIHTGHSNLAWFTLPHALVCVGNIVLYRVLRNKKLTDYIFGYGILALYTHMVGTGGIELTGPLGGFQ